MEKNPPIIWVRTPHSKKVVLYNLPSPLAYSTSPPSHPKHGRAVFLKDIYRNKYFSDGVVRKCELLSHFLKIPTGEL